jgi:hypothetical protein
VVSLKSSCNREQDFCFLWFTSFGVSIKQILNLISFLLICLWFEVVKETNQPYAQNATSQVPKKDSLNCIYIVTGRPFSQPNKKTLFGFFISAANTIQHLKF